MNQIKKKINLLLPEAPTNWADLIALKMGKSASSVRAYVRGEKGLRNGHSITVLKLLIEIVDERRAEIENLTKH
jgi:hypothetical protein